MNNIKLIKDEAIRIGFMERIDGFGFADAKSELTLGSKLSNCTTMTDIENLANNDPVIDSILEMTFIALLNSCKQNKTK